MKYRTGYMLAVIAFVLMFFAVCVCDKAPEISFIAAIPPLGAGIYLRIMDEQG